MTDYMELVNNLRLTERVCRDRMDGQVMLDAAAAIEDLQAKISELGESYSANLVAAQNAQPRWVRVEDGLPKENGRYIVYCQRLNAVKIDEFKNGLWLFASMFNFRGVTHWMPLPEPPKEEVYG